MFIGYLALAGLLGCTAHPPTHATTHVPTSLTENVATQAGTHVHQQHDHHHHTSAGCTSITTTERRGLGDVHQPGVAAPAAPAQSASGVMDDAAATTAPSHGKDPPQTGRQRLQLTCVTRT
jgi:hypothetical protein